MESKLLNIKQINRTLLIAILLNSAFVIIEAGSGYFANSLALISDAGHNLIDVFSLSLTYLAYRLSLKKSNSRFTYGYKKVTIYTALINALLLMLITSAILYKAIIRISHHNEVNGSLMIIIAIIGIIINSFSAWLLMKNQNKDMNLKASFLHLASDALLSVSVVISGILILVFGIYWIDPVISIFISLFILTGTYKLVKKSISLSLDAVPAKINVDEIKKEILSVEGIEDIHDLHIWALSTFQNAVTVHLCVYGNPDLNYVLQIKEKVRLIFIRYNIEHVTIDVENTETECSQDDC